MYDTVIFLYFQIHVPWHYWNNVLNFVKLVLQHVNISICKLFFIESKLRITIYLIFKTYVYYNFQIYGVLNFLARERAGDLVLIFVDGSWFCAVGFSHMVLERPENNQYVNCFPFTQQLYKFSKENCPY